MRSRILDRTPLTREAFEERRKIFADFADGYDDYDHYLRCEKAMDTRREPPTHTPLTDAELDLLECGAEGNRTASRAAAEIRALRATTDRLAERAEREERLRKEATSAAVKTVTHLRAREARLLAALKRLLAESESNEEASDDCIAAEDAAREAIAAAEGRAEG